MKAPKGRPRVAGRVIGSMHYLLEYHVADDFLARRAAHRAEHLALARAAAVRGELALGGSLAEPTDRALLVFGGPQAEAAARAFAAADPYVREGLVASFVVRPWTTVVGAEAAARLPDESPPRVAAAEGRAALRAFLAGARHGVIASVGPDGAPQAATVGFAVGAELELVFDTLRATRKAENLLRDGRAAAVITRGACTAQIEGAVDAPEGAELERVRALYLAAFPDGEARRTWPGITWLRLRPRWLRTTDFGCDPPAIVEWSAAALGGAG